MADTAELTVVPDYEPKPKEREIGPRKKYTDRAAFDDARCASLLGCAAS